jgi:hypothetical protein
LGCDAVEDTDQGSKRLAMVREACGLLGEELKSNSGTVLANPRWIAILKREALLLSDLSCPSLDQFEPAEAAQRNAMDGFRAFTRRMPPTFPPQQTW